MKSKLLIYLSLQSILILSVMACSEQKKLSEMHDSTLEMNKTTKDMSNTTLKMSNTTKELNNTTVQLLDKTLDLHNTIKRLDAGTSTIISETEDLTHLTSELYDAARQGDSKSLRRNSLKAMGEAQTLPAKASEAAAYFASFEFQLWSSLGQDSNLSKREDLMYEAVHEFFMNTADLYDPSVDYSFMATVNNKLNFLYSSKESSFYALAVTLHYVNRKQLDLIAKMPALKLSAASFFSMFKDALKAKSKIDSGEKHLADYPRYVEEVLANEKIVNKLLLARVNTFGLAFLAKYTSLTKNALTANSMRTKPWVFNPDSMNVAELNSAIEYISLANSTKTLMIESKISTAKNETIQRIFSNLRIVRSKNGTLEVKKLKSMLESALAEYIKP